MCVSLSFVFFFACGVRMPFVGALFDVGSSGVVRRRDGGVIVVDGRGECEREERPSDLHRALG